MHLPRDVQPLGENGLLGLDGADPLGLDRRGDGPLPLGRPAPRPPAGRPGTRDGTDEDQRERAVEERCPKYEQEGDAGVCVAQPDRRGPQVTAVGDGVEGEHDEERDEPGVPAQRADRHGRADHDQRDDQRPSAARRERDAGEQGQRDQGGVRFAQVVSHGRVRGQRARDGDRSEHRGQQRVDHLIGPPQLHADSVGRHRPRPVPPRGDGLVPPCGGTRRPGPATWRTAGSRPVADVVGPRRLGG